jgi:hypothetical protein
VLAAAAWITDQGTQANAARGGAFLNRKGSANRPQQRGDAYVESAFKCLPARISDPDADSRSLAFARFHGLSMRRGKPVAD